MIILKNSSSLFILVKYNKYKVLIYTIENIIYFISVFKTTDLIDVAFFISI